MSVLQSLPLPGAQVTQILSSTIPPDKTDLGAGTVAAVVITGISVVFIGLIILILLVTLYGKIFEAINEKAKAKAEAAEAERQKALEAQNAASQKDKAEPAAVETEAPDIEDGVEEEVVAVIMAAIAAMGAQSGKKLMLKSVKTAKGQRPVWASAGINENTRPF